MIVYSRYLASYITSYVSGECGGYGVEGDIIGSSYSLAYGYFTIGYGYSSSCGDRSLGSGVGKVEVSRSFC